jgi:hypothetical protein
MHSLRPWLIAALALPVASAAPSGFDVRVKDGLVTIDAREAPLSDVLDQLGRQTGMKLVYEAGRPRQIVSAVIEGVSPPVAVARLLEGLGVGYGFSLDPSGHRVETLLISGVTATVNTSARPAAPAPRSGGNGARFEPEIEAPEPPEEEAPEIAIPTEPEPAVAAPAVNLPGLANIPGMPNIPGLPGMTGAPGATGGGPPSFSPMGGPGMRAAPSFPGGASSPIPWIPAPMPPGAASSPQPQ